MDKLQDKLNEILSLNWSEEDKNTLSKIMESIIYYKRLIPSKFEHEVLACINICIREKRELDFIKKNEKN